MIAAFFPENLIKESDSVTSCSLFCKGKEIFEMLKSFNAIFETLKNIVFLYVIFKKIVSFLRRKAMGFCKKIEGKMIKNESLESNVFKHMYINYLIGKLDYKNHIKLSRSKSGIFTIINDLFPKFKIEGKNNDDVIEKLKNELEDCSIWEIDKFFGIV